MKGTLVCSVIVLLSATLSNGANILAIIPTPSYSHQVAYQELWRELSIRGHKVTVATTNPVKNPALTNLTEIDLSYIYDRVERKYDRIALIHSVKEDALQLFRHMMNIQSYILEEELNDPFIQKLIKKDNQHFDVVLAEFLYPAMYAFAALYKCPLITISSMDVTSTVYNSLGNPMHPVTHPDMIVLQMIPPLSFKDRIISSLFSVFISVYVNHVSVPRDNLVMKKHFGDTVPSLHELRKNISLAFLNIDPIFHTAKPLFPSVIPIGGGSHIKSTKPLPKDLERFLSNANQGVIFFSLGSNVKSENMNEETLSAIMEAFEELPYKVVWKFDAQHARTLPSKLYLSQWLPQQEILQHPNVKLFITQGGCQSIDESIYNHVPILGIPFFGDQISNIYRVVSNEIGLSLDYSKITKQDFKDTILELMKNPKYRNNIKKLADLARDQPMTGLELAVWWTEYVIRNKGAERLRSPFIDLPLYQYYHIDVIGFCLIIVCGLTFMTIKFLYLLMSFLKVKPETKHKYL